MLKNNSSLFHIVIFVVLSFLCIITFLVPISEIWEFGNIAKNTSKKSKKSDDLCWITNWAKQATPPEP